MAFSGRRRPMRHNFWRLTSGLHALLPDQITLNPGNPQHIVAPKAPKAYISAPKKRPGQWRQKCIFTKMNKASKALKLRPLGL